MRAPFADAAERGADGGEQADGGGVPPPLPRLLACRTAAEHVDAIQGCRVARGEIDPLGDEAASRERYRVQQEYSTVGGEQRRPPHVLAMALRRAAVLAVAPRGPIGATIRGELRPAAARLLMQDGNTVPAQTAIQ